MRLKCNWQQMNTLNTYRLQSLWGIVPFRPLPPYKRVNFDNNLTARTSRSFGWTHICMHRVCLVCVEWSANRFDCTTLCWDVAMHFQWISSRHASFQSPAKMATVRISTSNRWSVILIVNYPTLNSDVMPTPIQIDPHSLDVCAQKTIWNCE